MNESTLKRKRSPSTNKLNNKFTTYKKTLDFTDLCIDITRKKNDDLTLGKFVVNYLMVIKKIKNY